MRQVPASFEFFLLSQLVVLVAAVLCLLVPNKVKYTMERQKHHVLKIPTTSKILLKTCSLDLDAPHVPQPSSSVQFIGHGGLPRLHGFPTRCLREYFDGPEKPGGKKTTMCLTTNPLKKIFWWRKSSELVPKYVHADEKDRPGSRLSRFNQFEPHSRPKVLLYPICNSTTPDSWPMSGVIFHTTNRHVHLVQWERIGNQYVYFYPIASMYGMFTYIYRTNQPNL